MADKKRKIGRKVNSLLLAMVSVAILLSGGVSIYSLFTMKRISMESSRELGRTAAEDAEQALEEQAVDNLQDIAVEKAAYIEERFAAVEAYVLGIAAQAEDIYKHPEKYPDREVALPVPGSSELAAQLLWSQHLETDSERELQKLGNIQDLLVQYNAHNDMVSSTYLATESGWMIQADYISYSKYEGKETQHPLFYEADQRQWYQRARNCAPGQIVYTDVIQDIHQGGDGIVCASPVYLDGKIVAVAGVGSYLNTVNNAVLNTVIGEKGYAFLVNEKGQVMVSGRVEGETAALAEQNVDLRESNNAKLAEAACRMVDGETDFLKLRLDGREVYMAFAPLHRLGWSFVTVIDVVEVVAPAKESQSMILTLTENVAERQDGAIRQMLSYFVAVLAAVALCICLSGALFSKKLTDPIRRLTREVAQIDGGNLDYRIHIGTGDEVEDLGNAFNSMTAQIQSYVKNLATVTAEKERIRTEIQVASRLQADMLPAVEGIFTDRQDFTLAASMTPAKGVGGDFYDFFFLDENHLALVMADVSGKGVPAALFMVVSRTLIRSHISMELPLGKAVSEINNTLCDNNRNGMFVTAWIGVLTLSSGELIFVNAGHCRPLIKSGSGQCVYETTPGDFVLAGMEDLAYRQSKIRLHRGDTLLLYTDGVTEATSTQKELYGEGRLKVVAERAGSVSSEGLLKLVWRDVDSFQRGAEQFDDITMLAITYHGSDFLEKTGIPTMEHLQEFAVFVEENLKEQNIAMKNIAKCLMAVDEIFSNICYYSGATEVTMGLRVRDAKGKTALSGESLTAQGGESGKVQCIMREVTLYFEDNGLPFNPLDRPDPDVEELLENRRIGGLGIYMVKKRMDAADYQYQEGRNRLILTKWDRQ